MIGRLIPAMLLGLMVSAVLFWVMHAMLRHHEMRAGRAPLTQIDFVRLQRDEPPPETVVRELPPPPEPDAAPPPPAPDRVAPAEPSQPAAPAFDLPKLNPPVGDGGLAAPLVGGQPGLSMPEPGPGARAMPDAFGGQLAALVRIPPTYPIEARRKKIEGWVRVEFTVTEDGSVADARVKAADPPGVFDQAAVAAIARWKFRPALENGQPVRKRAAQTLRFELNR